MPDKVYYMGLLSLALILFSFFVIAAPQYSEKAKLVMGLAAPAIALAIDLAFFPNSVWIGSWHTTAGMIGYLFIMLMSVNAGTRWWEKHNYYSLSRN